MRIFTIVFSFAIFSNPTFAKKLDEFKDSHSMLYLDHQKKSDITSFRATWTVPAEPTVNNGQSIAIWNGLQPDDSKAVLQPVLQWGTHFANGGRNGWALACWGVKVDATSEVLFKSTPIAAVQPGDQVTGVMELVSKSNGVYTYKCYFEGYPNTELLFETSSKLNVAYLDYEIQDVTSCDDYSDNVTFEDVQVVANGKILKTKWLKSIEDPKKCGIKIKSSKKSLNAGGVATIQVK